MREFIRISVNKTLRRYGLEMRRKHDAYDFLAPIRFATIIDGGANVGDYIAGVRAMYPQAEIFAFEPTPRLHQGIQKRFAQDPRVTCYAQALSDRSGTAVFHVTPDTVSSSLLEKAEASNSVSESIEVPVTTLDTWAENKRIHRPLLLKLDVEGNELAALRGAEKLLSQVDYVELETTFSVVRQGQPTLREIMNFMFEHGFELVDVYPGILDSKTGRSEWADVLFAKKAATSSL